MKLTAILLTVLISVVSAEQPAESNLRELAKARIEERATNIFDAKAALEAEAERREAAARVANRFSPVFGSISMAMWSLPPR